MSHGDVEGVTRIWHCGPAQFVGDRICIDRADAFPYELRHDPALVFDLAKVKNHKLALRFVTEWGLLRVGGPSGVLCESWESLKSEAVLVAGFLTLWRLRSEHALRSFFERPLRAVRRGCSVPSTRRRARSKRCRRDERKSHQRRPSWSERFTRQVRRGKAGHQREVNAYWIRFTRRWPE